MALEQEFVVASELGLHARPAGELAALASRFSAEIQVTRADSDDWVSARSVLSLLQLTASRGTRLRLRAEGEDAAEALAALGELLMRPHQA